MLFYVDFLAACAAQTEFVGRCIREWDGGSASILMLPNWSFTNALLGWQLAQGRIGRPSTLTLALPCSDRNLLCRNLCCPGAHACENAIMVQQHGVF